MVKSEEGTRGGRQVGCKAWLAHSLAVCCLGCMLAASCLACLPAHTLHAVHRIVTSHTKHHMLYSTCLILGKLDEGRWRQP